MYIDANLRSTATELLASDDFLRTEVEKLQATRNPKESHHSSSSHNLSNIKIIGNHGSENMKFPVTTYQSNDSIEYQRPHVNAGVFEHDSIDIEVPQQFNPIKSMQSEKIKNNDNQSNAKKADKIRHKSNTKISHS